MNVNNKMYAFVYTQSFSAQLLRQVPGVQRWTYNEGKLILFLKYQPLVKEVKLKFTYGNGKQVLVRAELCKYGAMPAAQDALDMKPLTPSPL